MGALHEDLPIRFAAVVFDRLYTMAVFFQPGVRSFLPEHRLMVMMATRYGCIGGLEFFI
jgi:hypothetical protein